MEMLHDEEQWKYDALADMVHTSDDAIVLADPSGVVVLANKAAGEVVGVPHEAMPGHTVEDFGRESMHAFQKIAVAAVVDNNIEVTVRDAKLRHTNGTSTTVDLTLSPTRTDQGPFVAIGMREPNDKYRQTKLFRGLLEAAPDGMVIVNRDGVIVLVNAQVERLFGYERAELVGESVEILVPDRFSGMHMAFRSGYVSEPRTRPMGLAGDLHARRKDGSEFPVEVTLSPLETDEGLLVSAAVRDISERRRMQEENDRVKDEFFATVSHELRTPLTSMIGYGELMTDLEELSPQGQRFLSVIVRSAERELRLVDDLLTLVAIEESGLAIRSAEIDLERVVREAVEAARPRAEEAQLSAVDGDPRDRRTHVRRPRPPRPGHGQPALQRDQVHADRRARARRAAHGRDLCGDRRDRLRHRHRRRGPGRPVRAAVPLPDRGGAADAGRRTRADHRPGDRRGARRHHRGRRERRRRAPPSG